MQVLSRTNFLVPQSAAARRAAAPSISLSGPNSKLLQPPKIVGVVNFCSSLSSHSDFPPQLDSISYNQCHCEYLQVSSFNHEYTMIYYVCVHSRQKMRQKLIQSVNSQKGRRAPITLFSNGQNKIDTLLANSKQCVIQYGNISKLLDYI